MKIGIIGAGASGMMAAVTAAANGGEVLLIEKNDRVGKKILSTGNGKCNLSNLNFTMEQYYCADREKLHDIFSVFSLWDLLSFFESNGMMVRDKNGYLYPYSEQASTVLDIFRKMLSQEKIRVITGTEIKSAVYQEKKQRFVIKAAENEFTVDKLIIACGGPASQKKGNGMTGFQLAQGFGHQVQDVVPGLVQLKSDDSFIKGMAGVRTQAEVTLLIDGKESGREKGELQFTDYGLSGIPVFQFSRTAAYARKAGKKVQVKINLFPEYEEMHFLYHMRNRYESMTDVSLEAFLLGTVNKKINIAMMKYKNLKPETKVSEIPYEQILDLFHSYRRLMVHITDVNGMENAQVCAGGVDFSEITTEMESIRQPGLFFSGEVVDVDGKCGGYNLQWAFTSGYIAGRNAAGNSTRELIHQKLYEEEEGCLE